MYSVNKDGTQSKKRVELKNERKKEVQEHRWVRVPGVREAVPGVREVVPGVREAVPGVRERSPVSVRPQADAGRSDADPDST